MADKAARNGTRRRVAVIGAGFSGSVAAAHLLRLGKAGPHVTLIERARRFGPGLAYGETSGLLNAPARAMSAFPDLREHFLHWLEKREGGDQRERFAARRVYGAYLEHVLREAAGRRWPSALTRMRAAAVSCRGDGDGWRVGLASGREIAADAVVLALGHPPQTIPPPFDAGDLIDPWDIPAQRRLRRGDVLVLGAGLSAGDVVVALAARRETGVIYALSRHGRTPHPHEREATVLAPAHLPLELSAALHAFRAHARAGGDWRAMMEGLRPSTPELWSRLPLKAQERFLRHLRPFWDMHRHRAAPETAQRVAALIAEGRLRVLAGEIASASREGGVWRLQHRHRGSLARHRLEVSGVVNCAGADDVLARWDDALVRQLLQEGYARAPANGLGFDVDAHNRLRDGKGAMQPRLFALGPLAVGAFWETKAVPELRVRAAAIARQLE